MQNSKRLVISTEELCQAILKREIKKIGSGSKPQRVLKKFCVYSVSIIKHYCVFIGEITFITLSHVTFYYAIRVERAIFCIVHKLTRPIVFKNSLSSN